MSYSATFDFLLQPTCNFEKGISFIWSMCMFIYVYSQQYSTIVSNYNLLFI